MANFINIDIVTPEKTVFAGEIKSLTAPGIEGEFGVLPGHAPFATGLAPGVVVIRDKDNKEDMMAVSGGYIEVTGEKVILLVESANRAGEVDIEKIKKKKAEHERMLSSQSGGDIDYDKIQTQLLKEMSQLKALEMLNKRKSI